MSIYHDFAHLSRIMAVKSGVNARMAAEHLASYFNTTDRGRWRMTKHRHRIQALRMKRRWK